MDLASVSWHAALVVAAVALAPVGCFVSLGYALLVERRDSWRKPMLATAVLGAGAVLAAYATGDGSLTLDPVLSEAEAEVHRAYAVDLVLPTVGWLAVSLLTGWIHPRTGALRVMLPVLLFGFATMVLVLTVLAGDPDARSLVETVSESF